MDDYESLDMNHEEKWDSDAEAWYEETFRNVDEVLLSTEVRRTIYTEIQNTVGREESEEGGVPDSTGTSTGEDSLLSSTSSNDAPVVAALNNASTDCASSFGSLATPHADIRSKSFTLSFDMKPSFPQGAQQQQPHPTICPNPGMPTPPQMQNKTSSNGSPDAAVRKNASTDDTSLFGSLAMPHANTRSKPFATSFCTAPPHPQETQQQQPLPPPPRPTFYPNRGMPMPPRVQNNSSSNGLPNGAARNSASTDGTSWFASHATPHANTKTKPLPSSFGTAPPQSQEAQQQQPCPMIYIKPVMQQGSFIGQLGMRRLMNPQHLEAQFFVPPPPPPTWTPPSTHTSTAASSLAGGTATTSEDNSTSQRQLPPPALYGGYSASKEGDGPPPPQPMQPPQLASPLPGVLAIFQNQAVQGENSNGDHAILHDDTRRKTAKGYLLVNEVDDFLNCKGTVTQGTIAWRQDVRGTTRRHRKIPDDEVKQAVATIRRQYSQEIKQNHAEIYESSDQVDPALMVEEIIGECWRWHPNSRQYYWGKTGKLYRKASDAAIADSWSAKPYQKKKPVKPLADEFAQLEAKLESSRLQSSSDEAFAKRAGVVQDQFNLYKRDLSMWTGREHILIKMLEKSLELLDEKRKGTTTSKKRKTDSSTGEGGFEEDAKDNQPKGDRPPDQSSNQDQPTRTQFQGDSDSGGTVSGAQAQGCVVAYPDNESFLDWDGFDSDSESSLDYEDASSDGSDGSDDEDNDDAKDRILEPSESNPTPTLVNTEPSVKPFTIESTRIALEETTLRDTASSLTPDEDTSACDEHRTEVTTSSRYELVRSTIDQTSTKTTQDDQPIKSPNPDVSHIQGLLKSSRILLQEGVDTTYLINEEEEIQENEQESSKSDHQCAHDAESQVSSSETTMYSITEDELKNDEIWESIDANAEQLVEGTSLQHQGDEIT